MKKHFFTLASVFVLMFAQTSFAALSAIVTASPSTVIINQPSNLSIAISNTGSSMTLQNVQLTASYNGSTTSRVPLAFSVYNPSSVVLAANATTTVPMNAVFFSPSTGTTGSGSGKFYVGALLTTSDGTITGAGISAELTVNPVPLPAYQRQ